MFASGVTTLIISNTKKKKWMKLLEESGLLIKGVSERIKNIAKEQKGGFLGMLLALLMLVY